MSDLDLFEQSLANAQEGMRRALDHAEADHAGWGEIAYAYLKHYAETHDRFPGWMVTHTAALEKAVPAASGKAWGSVFTKAVRGFVIANDGYAKDPNRNANPCPVWKSLLYKNGRAA